MLNKFKIIVFLFFEDVAQKKIRKVYVYQPRIFKNKLLNYK